MRIKINLQQARTVINLCVAVKSVCNGIPRDGEVIRLVPVMSKLQARISYLTTRVNFFTEHCSELFIKQCSHLCRQFGALISCLSQ